jgi:uncharacterized protein YidB (DUF937 family)
MIWTAPQNDLEVAAHFGLPMDKILATVAEQLPAKAGKLSPNGTLQEAK